MYLRRLALSVLLAVQIAPAAAQPVQAPPQGRRLPPGANPLIDFNGYRDLAREVEPYRRARLIDWSAFAAAAAQREVLILDARSESAFAEGHIQGAINVPLPDFTAERLAEVIGNTDRPILIYCNNNFSNNRRPVVTKLITLALNIQTFINLYGYGYRNIRELGEVVDFNDPRIPWVRGPVASTITPSPRA